MKALLVMLVLNSVTGVYEVKHEIPMPTITFCERAITPIAGTTYLLSNGESTIFRCHHKGIEYQEIKIPI